MDNWKVNTCPDCNGSGYDLVDDGQCDRCAGSGEIEVNSIGDERPHEYQKLKEIWKI